MRYLKCLFLVGVLCLGRLLYASPAGQIDPVFVASPSLDPFLLEETWIIKPNNPYSKQTLKYELMRKCKKTFGVKHLKGFDKVVAYDKEFCNKAQGHFHRRVKVKLAIPAKILEEAFDELSQFWHDVNYARKWRPHTKKDKRYSDQEEAYLKVSKDKKYIFVYELGNEHPEKRSVSVTRIKDQVRMLSLYGTQYNEAQSKEIEAQLKNSKSSSTE